MYIYKFINWMGKMWLPASFDLLPVFKGIFGKLSDLQNISHIVAI